MNPLAPTTAGTHHSITAEFSLRFPSTWPLAAPVPRPGASFYEVGHGEE